MSNETTWITVWDKDNYKGDNQTIRGAQQIDDLSERYYGDKTSGLLGQLDDSISSLETGPNTWVCLFSSSMYRDYVLRVGPKTPIEKLKDKKHANPNGDWENDIASMIIYDSKPNFWDTENHVSEGECWLKLYQGKRFSKYCYTIRGAGKIPSLSCLNDYSFMVDTDSHHGGAKAVLTQRVPASMTTGPGTWVQLFSGYNGVEADLIGQFGPNTIIDDLKDYTSRAVNSIRVYDAVPEGFTGNSGKIPDDVISIQQAQTSAAIGNALAGVVGLIPEAGGVLSLMVNILWPDNSLSPEKVWKDMARAAEGMMQGLIDAEKLRNLDKKLGKLYDLLADYEAEKPGQAKLAALGKVIEKLDDIESDLMPHAQDNTYINPAQNLPYLVNVGTVAIVVFALRAYNYRTISGGSMDGYDASWPGDLDTKISELRTAVQNGLQGTLSWRLHMISYTPTSSKNSKYELTDTYTGYSCEYDKQNSVEAAYSSRKKIAYDAYSQWLLGMVSQANFWPCFISDNINQLDGGGGKSFPDAKFITKPAPVDVVVKLGSYQTNSNGPRQTVDVADNPITGVTLYSDSERYAGVLTGIKFGFQDGTKQLIGFQNSNDIAAVLEPGEQIVGFYGGSGSFVDQLVYRTSLGRDFGNGGGGGSAFVCSPPQGVGAVTSRISAVSTGCLVDYVHEWTYRSYSFKGEMLTTEMP